MSADALAGLCPRCLLAGVLEDDDRAERSGESAVADLTSGTTLGPFVIVELLGKGGMATVYHAYETELDRDVALKVLPPEFLHDPSFARRFEREAQVVAKLEHPNIVPIYASGIDAGIPWMSMRHLAGGSLDSILKRERLGVTRVMELLRGVAEGLDYAHAHGVIHRDVKPSNILLDDAHHVCVGDFGLARVSERSLVHTQTAMAGTPHYMAPEQALGGDVDHRCDIYSLGIVVYEMLTGRVPFAADSPVAVLMKHVSEPIPIPSGQGPAEPLWKVVEQCLAKEPDGRWPSATAFAAALDDAVTTAALEADAVLVAPELQSATAPMSNSRGPVAEVPPVAPAPWRAVLAWTAAAALSLATLVGVTTYLGRESTAVTPSDPPATLRSEARSQSSSLPVPETPRPEADKPASTVADEVAGGGAADEATGSPTATLQADVGAAALPPEGLETEPSTDGVPPSDAFEPDVVYATERQPALVNEVVGVGTATPQPAPPVGALDPTPEVSDVESEQSPRATPPEPAPAVGEVEPVLVLASVVTPPYPPAARILEYEGDVLLELTIDAEGHVTDARVLDSPYGVFEQPAINAAFQWRYTPGLRNGVPAEFTVQATLPFRFEP